MPLNGSALSFDLFAAALEDYQPLDRKAENNENIQNLTIYMTIIR